ncbi:alpha/beta fold hydrolase [Halobaculum sp. WSA2]|uniref:Alpha/beta fold hydrolase n=1 Tax=Halobaculum saliterrae TaxID=2073113 RepID=A0A6B0SZJ1_9EURY|nr:alpha/beta hydrolase [Halobaculum saliterrae]MXR39829.1 alpha/beta fold hydrolase [Halobaculum saliterrae]
MPTVETNDVETYYERRGDGPPVVFVHGAIVDHTQWAPQLDALADEYTVVAYDVRGHGRTGGSDREAYSIGLFAEDLAALIDALDLDRPVVCGLSMGGCVAMTYAARYPDGLSALVLADTFGPVPLTLGERLQRASLRLTIPPARVVGYERVERAMVWLRERAEAGIGGDYDRIEAIRETGPAMSTAEFAKVIRALASFDRTRVDLSSIEAPTLVLYGEHDAGFVRRQSAALGALIRDATVLEVPDVGHASTLDQPAFVTAEIRRLLEHGDTVNSGAGSGSGIEFGSGTPDPASGVGDA